MANIIYNGKKFSGNISGEIGRMVDAAVELDIYREALRAEDRALRRAKKAAEKAAAPFIALKKALIKEVEVISSVNAWDIWADNYLTKKAAETAALADWQHGEKAEKTAAVLSDIKAGKTWESWVSPAQVEAAKTANEKQAKKLRALCHCHVVKNRKPNTQKYSLRRYQRHFARRTDNCRYHLWLASRDVFNAPKDISTTGDDYTRNKNYTHELDILGGLIFNSGSVVNSTNDVVFDVQRFADASDTEGGANEEDSASAQQQEGKNMKNIKIAVYSNNRTRNDSVRVKNSVAAAKKDLPEEVISKLGDDFIFYGVNEDQILVTVRKTVGDQSTNVRYIINLKDWSVVPAESFKEAQDRHLDKACEHLQDLVDIWPKTAAAYFSMTKEEADALKKAAKKLFFKIRKNGLYGLRMNTVIKFNGKDIEVHKMFVKKGCTILIAGKPGCDAWGKIILNENGVSFKINNEWDALVTDILTEMETGAEDSVGEKAEKVKSAIADLEANSGTQFAILRAMQKRVLQLKEVRIAAEALGLLKDGKLSLTQQTEEATERREAGVNNIKQFNHVTGETAERTGESIKVSTYCIQTSSHAVHLVTQAPANAFTQAAENYLTVRKCGTPFYTIEKRFLEQYIVVTMADSEGFSMFMAAESKDRKLYRPWGSDDLFFFSRKTRCYVSLVSGRSIDKDEWKTLCTYGYVIFDPALSIASAGNQKNKTIEIMGRYQGKDMSKNVPWQLIYNNIMHGAIVIAQEMVRRGHQMTGADFSEFAVRLAMGKAPYKQYETKPNVIMIVLGKELPDGVMIGNVNFLKRTFDAEWRKVKRSTVRGYAAQSRDENMATKGVIHTVSEEAVEEAANRLSKNGVTEYVLPDITEEQADALHEILFLKGKRYLTEEYKNSQPAPGTAVILYSDESFVGQTPDLIVDMNAIKTATNIEQLVGGLRILSVIADEDTEMVLSTQLARSLFLINFKIVADWMKAGYYETAQKLFDKVKGKSAKKLSARDLRQAFEDIEYNENGEALERVAKDIDWEDIAVNYDPDTTLNVFPSIRKKLHNQNLKKLFKMLNGTNYPVKGTHKVLIPDVAQTIFGIDLLGLKPNGDLEIFINGDSNKEFRSIEIEEIKNRVFALVEAGTLTREQGEILIGEYEALHPGCAMVSVKEYIAKTGEGWDFDGDTIYIFTLDIDGMKVTLAIRYPKTHLRGFFIVAADDSIRKNQIFKTIEVNICATPIGTNKVENEKVYKPQGTDCITMLQSTAEILRNEFVKTHENMVELAVGGYAIPSYVQGNVAGSAFLGSMNYALQIPKQVGDVIVMFTPVVDLLIYSWILKTDADFKRTYSRNGDISLAAAYFDLIKIKKQAAYSLMPKRVEGEEVQVPVISGITKQAYQQFSLQKKGSKIAAWALDNIVKTFQTVFKVKPCWNSDVLEREGYKGFGLVTQTERTEKGEKIEFVNDKKNKLYVTNTLVNGVNDPMNPTCASQEGMNMASPTQRGYRYNSPLTYEKGEDIGQEINRVSVSIEQAEAAMEMSGIFKIGEDEEGNGIWTDGVDNLLWLSDIYDIAMDFNAIIRFFGEGTIDQVKKPVASMLKGIMNEIGLRAAKMLSRKRTFAAEIDFSDKGLAGIKYGVDREGSSVVTTFNTADYKAAKCEQSTVHKFEKEDNGETGMQSEILDACALVAHMNLEVPENYAKAATVDLNSTDFAMPKAEVDAMYEMVVKKSANGMATLTDFAWQEVRQSVFLLTRQWLSANKAIELKKKELMSMGISEKSDTFKALLDTLKAFKRVVFGEVINTAQAVFEELGIADDALKVSRLLWITSAIGYSLYMTNKPSAETRKSFKAALKKNVHSLQTGFVGARFLQWVIKLGEERRAEMGEDATVAPLPYTFDKLYLCSALQGREAELDGKIVFVRHGEISYQGVLLAWVKDSLLEGEYEIKVCEEEDGPIAYLVKEIEVQLPKMKADRTRVSLQLHEYIGEGNNRVNTNPEEALQKVAGKEVFLIFTEMKEKDISKSSEATPKSCGLFIKTEDNKLEFIGGIQGTTMSLYDNAPALRKVYGCKNGVMKGFCSMGMKAAQAKGKTIVDEFCEEKKDFEWHYYALLCLENFTPATDVEKEWAKSAEIVNVAVNTEAATIESKGGRKDVDLKIWYNQIDAKILKAGSICGYKAAIDESHNKAAVFVDRLLYLVRLDEVKCAEDILQQCKYGTASIVGTKVAAFK